MILMPMITSCSTFSFGKFMQAKIFNKIETNNFVMLFYYFKLLFRHILTCSCSFLQFYCQ